MNILSIDLDYFWSSTLSNEIDTQKTLTKDYELFLGQINKLKYSNVKVGIDHSELLLEIDEQYNSKKLNITNLDAHHDLFLKDYKLWLLERGTRGKYVEIGNFFYFLLQENKLNSYQWIVPQYFDIEQTKLKLNNEVGNYYYSKINLSKSLNHINDKHYDLFFISISPEWIPKTAMDWIVDVLNIFNIQLELIEKLRSKINERWNLKDNNTLIRNHRFKYPNNFLNAK